MFSYIGRLRLAAQNIHESTFAIAKYIMAEIHTWQMLNLDILNIQCFIRTTETTPYTLSRNEMKWQVKCLENHWKRRIMKWLENLHQVSGSFNAFGELRKFREYQKIIPMSIAP